MSAYAGWVAALFMLWAFAAQSRRHAAIVELLAQERQVLWDQIERWEPIIATYAEETERRARQAVTN